MCAPKEHERTPRKRLPKQIPGRADRKMPTPRELKEFARIKTKLGEQVQGDVERQERTSSRDRRTLDATKTTKSYRGWLGDLS